MLAALATVPFARAGDATTQVGIRLVPLALVALVLGLVLGWHHLVAAAVVVVGGFYGAQLAVSDAPLDPAVPVLAAGFLVAAELAYWSLDERDGVRPERGETLRRIGFIALLAIGALVVATALLVLVDSVRVRGLGVDLVGTLAAVAVLVAVLAAGRARSSGTGGGEVARSRR